MVMDQDHAFAVHTPITCIPTLHVSFTKTPDKGSFLHLVLYHHTPRTLRGRHSLPFPFSIFRFGGGGTLYNSTSFARLPYISL